jgi:copper transport protein
VTTDRTRAPRRLGRSFTLAVLTSVLLLAPAAAAHAHAGFVSSDPADGAELATPPDEVTLTFTESVDAELSRIELLDATGTSRVLDGVTRPSPEVLRAPLGKLHDGVYTVSWFALSTVDGHLTAGAFSFGVGVSPADSPPPEAAPPSSPGPSVLGVTGRVGLYAGLSLLVALGAIGAGVFAGRLRAARLVPMVGAVLAFAGTLLLIAAETRLVEVSASDFLSADAGQPYVRLLLGVATAGAAAVLVAARPNRGTMALAGLVALAPLYVRASSGHAASAGFTQEIAQTVHFAAVGVWIGGLALLALLLRERRGDPPAAEAARFSRLALVAVGVVVATGVSRWIEETGGIGEVVDTVRTGYGQVLAIKVGLAVGLIALGALNRFRSVPRIAAGDSGLLRRVVGVELVAALGVLTLTGALTSLPPGGAVTEAPAAPAAVTAAGNDFATTIRVELTATPGVPGPNDIEVRVRDFDSDEPAAADAVALRFALVGADLPPTSLDLEADGDAWVGRGSQLSIAGTWEVTVRVITGARALEIPLAMTTRVPGAAVSDAELPSQPTLTTITYADRTSAQLYLDPGEPGPNQVHLTVFDAAGRELQLDDDARLVMMGPDRVARAVDVLRFGPGHFVANVDLEPGSWTFDFTSTTTEGDGVQATMRRTIGAET